MLKLMVGRLGNSPRVVLPKDVIDRLKTGAGRSLYLIDAPNDTHLVLPNDPSVGSQLARAEDIMQRYHRTLCVLAE